jgi:hypothetical protein
MRRIKYFSLVVFAWAVGCASLPSATHPKGFNFYWSSSENESVLNMTAGTYTKAGHTINLQFTPEEISRILWLADLTRFWDMPDTIKGPQMRMIEWDEDTMTIGNGKNLKTVVTFGLPVNEFGYDLQIIENAIGSILSKKPGYDTLPIVYNY